LLYDDCSRSSEGCEIFGGIGGCWYDRDWGWGGSLGAKQPEGGVFAEDGLLDDGVGGTYAEKEPWNVCEVELEPGVRTEGCCLG